METILPALLAATIVLLSTMMLGRSSFTSFRVLGDSFQSAEERSIERVRSDITITSISFSGSTVDVDIRNDGETRVVDFSKMDVVIQYTSGSSFIIKYADFTTQTAPQPSGTWRVVALTNDVIDPGVLNAGETMSITIELSPSPGAGSHWLQVTTELGISASSFFI